MKILLAPDSFKGSISAKSLCGAMREGIERVVHDAVILERPLADGGEGTMENLVHATNGTIITVTVLDPLKREITASYGVLGDQKTVVIEMAQASGLPLLSNEERDPLNATSFGTGQLIKEALEQGYRNFIIGLGGSATNDGGIGMLKALGVQFLDSSGTPLRENMEAVQYLSSINTSGLDARIKDSTFTIASDVQSPLCGSNGASAVFGPQKGATEEMIVQLDKALAQFAKVIFDQGGMDVVNIPGAGAAGGMGAALLAFLSAKVESGIGISMDVIRFDEDIKEADLIITGEGKLDSQTLSGKVIAGVCKRAAAYGVPVVALCGKNELSSNELNELGLLAGLSVVPGPCTLEEAFIHIEEWSKDRTEQILRLVTARK
ncbi:glycerate kinase [Halalkalibacter wakoensis JCM 9140]|uniref:Glycerate kinase n=1 Tax=Halalkalibacter wakoensis JCM 9140 TaxID=1236970 RepID=W4Q202_9BACI|nr:glycerate kinase [Halalkalibacter wakoensis]GAE25960.1 glycerate kinase [Halalkalibacter wakoensis JCM 9140]